eukprot:TRINITY_DN2113_c0_g1_i2.p1 TRINITY_DN2113_c0_g1~~TRINITY_DN2113_c0_g1_i2.p1  ORF type:complete len:197 (+),score=15.42 TRINITY_DN2113_c0_g1_i2:15-605(+)
MYDYLFSFTRIIYQQTYIIVHYAIYSYVLVVRNSKRNLQKNSNNTEVRRAQQFEKQHVTQTPMNSQLLVLGLFALEVLLVVALYVTYRFCVQLLTSRDYKSLDNILDTKAPLTSDTRVVKSPSGKTLMLALREQIQDENFDWENQKKSESNKFVFSLCYVSDKSEGSEASEQKSDRNLESNSGWYRGQSDLEIIIP